MQALKRLLALGIICTLLLPPARAAGGAITVPVTIRTGIPGTPAVQAEAAWDDGWFREDPAVYRHKLAETSMILSAAAYISGQNSGILEALGKLGFKNATAYHYQADASSGAAAYVFAGKVLPDVGAGTSLLVAVVIRGTDEYAEWSGNLDLGAGPDHQGFAGARDELLANLKEYLARWVPSGEPVRFLVTGHSRGGAVANLTAAALAEAPFAVEDGVYAYTFGSPAVSTQAKAEGYGYIFNIVSGSDLVTQIPLPDWGYRRYGVDLFLPDPQGDGALRQRMEQTYTALTGQAYAAYQDGKAVEKMTAAIHRAVPSVSGSATEMLSALLQGDLEGLAQLVRRGGGLAALLLGQKALALSGQLTPLLRQEAGAMASVHCMAAYYSWLAACETEEDAAALFGQARQ